MPRPDLQPTLWDQPRARRTDPRVSHDAARSMRSAAAAQRRTILVALLGGPMIADEVDAVCDFRATTAGRRLPEMERAGLVRVTGNERPTRSGRAAREYALTATGCAAASEAA